MARRNVNSLVNLQTGNTPPIARCDRSGLVGLHSDLCQQMEIQGKEIVWTGLWVDKEQLDQLNPIASLVPLMKPDPIPVPNPRPWQERSIDAGNEGRVASEINEQAAGVGINPGFFAPWERINNA